MKKFFVISLFFCNTFFRSSAQDTLRIVIDPSKTYQTIESFGASDCWMAKDVGYYWDDEVKEGIAKMLFSSNMAADGSPEGIGLSQWRFNLGSGSVGDDDLPSTRQTESFLNGSGIGYDWNKQAGQQWFMDKARGYGCTDFVAFANSPLVKYTRNGKGYASSGDGNSNLQADKYDDYAEYVGDVMKHFEDVGKGFKYFSPVNEPQYDWADASQEGSPWQNNEIKNLVVELDKSFQARNIDTKILLAEAGDWTYLYMTSSKNGGRASNQIYTFCNTTSSNYIRNLPSLAAVMGAHSYWTTSTNSQMQDVRTMAKAKADEYGLKLFQTEWSMLSGGEGVPEDLSESSYLDNALFLAKTVYCDMKYAQVSSWSYWTAMGVEQYGHKNRFLLISLTPGGGLYGPMTLTGTALATKNLWTLGNYSYFIRPGYKRIELSGADNIAELMGTAYLAPDLSRIVAVYVNMANADKKIAPQFQNLSLSPSTNKRYFTNDLYNLRKYGSSSSDAYSDGKVFIIPARSVMTFVYDFDKVNTYVLHTIQGNSDISPNPVRRGNILSLQLSGTLMGSNVSFSLTSLNGKAVLHKNFSNEDGHTCINIPGDIPPGVYLVRVNSSKESFVRKLLVY